MYNAQNLSLLETVSFMINVKTENLSCGTHISDDDDLFFPQTRGP